MFRPPGGDPDAPSLFGACELGVTEAVNSGQAATTLEKLRRFGSKFAVVH